MSLHEYYSLVHNTNDGNEYRTDIPHTHFWIDCYTWVPHSICVNWIPHIRAYTTTKDHIDSAVTDYRIVVYHSTSRLYAGRIRWLGRVDFILRNCQTRNAIPKLILIFTAMYLLQHVEGSDYYLHTFSDLKKSTCGGETSRTVLAHLRPTEKNSLYGTSRLRSYIL